MVEYDLIMTDSRGSKVANLNNTLGFTATRVLNGIGWVDMSIPFLEFDRKLLKRDYTIQVWRKPYGLWRPYFLRKWNMSGSGASTALVLSGPCVNDLLRRRHSIGYSGQSYTLFTNKYTDAAMKQIVRNSLSDSIPPTPTNGTRDFTNLSVQADGNYGPQITLSFAYDKLLKKDGSGTLADLNEISRNQGDEVVFDIEVESVQKGKTSYRFITKSGLLGSDKTTGSNAVLFSTSNENLISPNLDFDYSEEENYIYSGGQKRGTDRTIKQAWLTDDSQQSIYYRCEGFVDSRNQKEDDAVQERANREVNLRKGSITFTGTAISTDRARFQEDWRLGDKVAVEYAGFSFTAIIRAVVLTVDSSGAENITARLDYESSA